MSALTPYLPIFAFLLVAVLFALGMLVFPYLASPSRPGPRKLSVYESGMEPFGTARQRFNVKYYLIALVFIVFDVELLFLYPWAVAFGQPSATVRTPLVLAEIIVFLAILAVAYLYARRKGVFRWD